MFRRFLRVTRIWILAIPFTLLFFGVASNQAVLVANHDKFPVMLNERKTAHLNPDAGSGLIDDDDHCTMTGQTHLNMLADWIDLKDAIYSPGDLLIELADFTSPYAPLLWAILMIGDALRREE